MVYCKFSEATNYTTPEFTKFNTAQCTQFTYFTATMKQWGCGETQKFSIP